MALQGPAVAADGDLAVLIQGRPYFSGAPTPDPAARLLALWRERGADLLEQLGGQYALGVLDAARGEALLAVDPMGIERLAFALQDGLLVFSDTAERVANFAADRPPLDLQAVFAYLVHHEVPAPRTIFAGVGKLRAGHCVSLRDGRLHNRRHWQPQFTTPPGAGFDVLRAELRGSLDTAVRASQPDKATGAFLSGGLDSSTVAGVLNGIAPPACTFSIGFGYPQYDELPYARIANSHFGCRGHEYTVHGSDIAASFTDIARAYDEPFGNSSALPVYYCARLAREHGITHLLAGDGGDELYAGNSRYLDQRVFEHYQRVPRLLRKGVLEPLLQLWPAALSFWPVRKARGYVAKATMPLPQRLEAWNAIYQAGAAQVLDPACLGAIDAQAPLRDMQEVWDACPSKNTLDRMLFYDWQYTLADNDLRKVQTMCALAGVTVSYPMLHPAVIANSLRVTPQLKLHGGELRGFYKRAMADFLPAQIIAKKKHGFGLPFGLWLQETAALREIIFDSLAGLRKRRLLRSEFIDRLQKQHSEEHAAYYGVFLWVLAMLEQWLQEHGYDLP
ncbi:MAG: asparagine synthase [Proteobacteria bacterium]|nr:asparagine synthase [Pseudomonadota bacterium]